MSGVELGRRCSRITATVREWVERIPGTRRAQEGVRAAIVGPGERWKSSLLNALVGYDRAIVDEASGYDPRHRGGVDLGRGSGIANRRHGWAARGADRVEGLGVERSATPRAICDLAVLVLDRSGGLGDADREAASWVRGSAGRRGVEQGGSECGSRAATSSARSRGRGSSRRWRPVAVRPGGAEPLLGRAFAPRCPAC